AGAGMTGLEAALAMSRAGKTVTVVDMLPYEKIGAGGTAINLISIKDLLKEAGVAIKCGVRIEDITADGVLICCTDGTKETLPCDTAVLSFGFRTDQALLDTYSGITPNFYVIGDCSGKGGGNVKKAVTTAFDTAMQI
ncbi:MAG: FAD-dependent oxidoreductase, partial [Oscillospiraceae bacterium]